jgi:acid phosphatase (class A)
MLIQPIKFLFPGRVLRLGLSPGLLTGLALFAASLPPLQAADKALSYLTADRPDARGILPDPPQPGSVEQAADMASVVAVHAACTPNEVAAALAEKKFSVFNFTPAVGAFFLPENLPQTTAFFKHVQTDAATITDQAKDVWQRPRPYMVDPSLVAGKVEKSFSYPSGHSTESMVLALVLADLLPDKKPVILAAARTIGWHRVQIARHYPTDIYAGRVFAQAIVREMKASPAFQKDFAAAKAELTAAQAAGKN